MATAVQLSFALRTSPNVKTVHLLGSWDGYKNQLPLSKDGSAGKPGAWKGTFRFQGATLKLGQRYWYYYIIDGYHVSHDPAKEHTTEPTTGRKLNILDVPGGKSSTADKRSSQNVAHGRALSPGKIQHPRPTKAYASQKIRQADYTRDPDEDSEVDELADRLESSLGSYREYSTSPSSGFSSSPSSSDCGSDRSSPSSLSSLSTQSCRCERYGITRSGNRVKLDCGGARCGYGSSSDSSSGCSSDSDSDVAYTTKRPAASKAPTKAPAKAPAKSSRPAVRGRK